MFGKIIKPYKNILAAMKKKLSYGTSDIRGEILLPGGLMPGGNDKTILKTSWSLNNCTILANAERGLPIAQ